MTKPQITVTLDPAYAQCLYAALGAALNPPAPAPAAEEPVELATPTGEPAPEPEPQLATPVEEPELQAEPALATPVPESEQPPPAVPGAA